MSAPDDNTVLRTSIHTCIVTKDALDYFDRDETNLTLEVMPLPKAAHLVMTRVLVPPHKIEGGHLRAVIELTQRVDKQSTSP